MKKAKVWIQTHTRYLSNLSATFLSQLVSALSVLVLSPILLARLGEQEFGTYGVILNLVVFASIFDFGLNLGLLKKLIHRYQASAQLVNTVLLFFCGLWILGLPLAYGAFELGWVKLPNHSLFYAAITVLLVSQNGMAAMLDVIIQSTNKIYLGKAIRVVKLLLEFVLILWLSNHHGAGVLLAISFGVNFLYLALLFYFAQQAFPFSISLRQFSFVLLVEHMGYSFWYFLTTVSGMLVFNSQVLLLQSVMGSNAVAKYLMVTRFFEIIRMGIANFTAILIPQLAILQENGHWLTLRLSLVKSIKRVAFFSLFIFLGLYYFGQPYFLLWSKFPDAEMLALFKLFTLFMFFIAIDNVSANYISALKWNQLPTLVSVLQGLLGLLLGWLLLENMGLLGLACGSVVALLLTNFIFNPWYLLKRMRIQINAATP